VYLAALAEKTAWHAKTLGGTVLYGLPMTELRVSLKVHRGVAR